MTATELLSYALECSIICQWHECAVCVHTAHALGYKAATASGTRATGAAAQRSLMTLRSPEKMCPRSSSRMEAEGWALSASVGGACARGLRSPNFRS